MSLSEVLQSIPVGLVDDVVELLKMIVSSDDSKVAVDRAKAALVSDAADAIADEALRKALGAGSK